jgi:hypothetical protein
LPARATKIRGITRTHTPTAFNTHSCWQIPYDTLDISHDYDISKHILSGFNRIAIVTSSSDKKASITINGYRGVDDPRSHGIVGHRHDTIINVGAPLAAMDWAPVGDTTHDAISCRQYLTVAARSDSLRMYFLFDLSLALQLRVALYVHAA